MQMASRQCLWGETGLGTEVMVELNEETGLYLNFLVRFVDDRPVRISCTAIRSIVRADLLMFVCR